MNLQVPPELEAKLTRLAAEIGRTVNQVALGPPCHSVDHDDGSVGRGGKGSLSAREGRLLDRDEVVTRMDRRYRG